MVYNSSSPLQVLVERLEMERRSEEGSVSHQGSSRAMKVVVIMVALVYLSVLGWLLLSVAKEGIAEWRRNV